LENTEGHCEKIWKIWKKVGWIVKWYGKCGRKASWILKRYGKYGRKASWIVKRYVNYGKQLWKDREIMEETPVE
jgi:hypothetical protein